MQLLFVAAVLLPWGSPLVGDYLVISLCDVLLIIADVCGGDVITTLYHFENIF